MANKRKDSRGRVLKKGESQKENDLYMYRWANEDGKRKYVYGKTLEELRQKEAEIEKELVLGVSRSSITLNEQIEVYFDIKVNLAKSTINNYRRYYEHDIKNSRLGKMKVIDIKKSDILRFYKRFSESGHSAGTVKILHKIIRPALQLACDDDIILKNPADGCTKDYTDEVEKKYALTIEEEKEFLDRIQNNKLYKRYYPMYAILLETGLRISELVGLTWNDVDMAKREISINHQVQFRFIDGKNQYYASETKTKAGKRVIPMTEDLHKLFLKQRQVWFEISKDTDFEVDGYKDFVFVSHISGQCMNHNYIRHAMKVIVSKNDSRDIQLPNITPHILRHTKCTRLAEAGYDIKVIQYLLGQTDIRTTMRVYNHVDQERVKREIEKRENQLNIASN